MGIDADTIISTETIDTSKHEELWASLKGS